MDIKIRNKFNEIKYSVSYWLVIFITNYRWFRILKRSTRGDQKVRALMLQLFNDIRYRNEFW